MARKIQVNKDGVPVKWSNLPLKWNEEDAVLMLLIVPAALAAAGILFYLILR